MICDASSSKTTTTATPNVTPQASESQHSGPKAYRPWQKEGVERLIGWIEDYVDLAKDKPSEWAKRAQEEVISPDDHISPTKIQIKARNMRRAYDTTEQSRLEPNQDGDLPRKMLSNMSVTGLPVLLEVRWNVGAESKYNATSAIRPTGTRGTRLGFYGYIKFERKNVRSSVCSTGKATRKKASTRARNAYRYFASQEQVAEIMARSHERIAASNKQTMQAVLAEGVLIPLGVHRAGHKAHLPLSVKPNLHVFQCVCPLPLPVRRPVLMSSLFQAIDYLHLFCAVCCAVLSTEKRACGPAVISPIRIVDLVCGGFSSASLVRQRHVRFSLWQ